jgi:hypothetical protein
MPDNSENPLVVLPGPTPVKSNDDADRRRCPRFPFTATAHITELHSQTSVACRSSDLGLGGCYIDILSPFAVGSVAGVRDLQQVLNELINRMVRNKSISESEGSALLRNFSH